MKVISHPVETYIDIMCVWFWWCWLWEIDWRSLQLRLLRSLSVWSVTVERLLVLPAVNRSCRERQFAGLIKVEISSNNAVFCAFRSDIAHRKSKSNEIPYMDLSVCYLSDCLYLSVCLSLLRLEENSGWEAMAMWWWRPDNDRKFYSVLWQHWRITLNLYRTLASYLSLLVRIHAAWPLKRKLKGQ